MDPGRLDQRVTLERRSRVADGAGGGADAWTAVAELWAAVAPISGRERTQARQVESPALYRVTIRPRADLTTADRFVWQGRRLNVRFVADPGPRPLYLTCDCETGVA
jgi:SPP1 family predicted phage head-tail adaptor